MNDGSASRRLGEVIGGKYRIVRFLARGGMGVVYEAQHAIVHRRFALKFLRPDLARRRDILTRFQREAEAAGGLENENVAAAIDFGISDDGTPYIVMEYLVGESLATLLEREGRLPTSRATDLLVQACRGVAAAHAAGIVHRDLKPHNLFVCRRDDGTDLLKVLDFGVAKLQAIDEVNAATRTGTMLGTAAYMSPEQARGDKAVDWKADVYALGAILYELLSGRKPHPGDSQNAILHHIATQPALPLETVASGLPIELIALVTHALAGAPSERPASAEVFGRALAPFARREVWPAMPAAPDASDLELDDLIPTVLARDGVSDASSHRVPERVVPPGIIEIDIAPPVPPARAAETTASRRVGTRAAVGVIVLLAIAAFTAIAVRRLGGNPRADVTLMRARRPVLLTPDTRFLSSELPLGAVQQIEALEKAGAIRDAALLNAMVATPVGIWLLGGSPQQVQAEVGDTVARGARQGRVPILVAYNHPFRDCTGYGLGGAADTAAYEVWIDALVAGIRNEKAVVILEPNSLGLIPYATGLYGFEDKCKPTRAEADGRRVAPPGATPEERYAQLAYAIDSIAAKAPNAAVYIDGTHTNWLPVGEAAYRLEHAGIERAAGFFLNVGNYQWTESLIKYGTWVSKCIRYARTSAAGRASPKPYRECATPPQWADTNDPSVWLAVDAWYSQHVDHASETPVSAAELTHFVINTNRNGKGPLIAAIYAGPPYNQPSAVIDVLQNGSWCMPPNRGLGFRPAAQPGPPLVDAYLWTEVPGISVVSCDIAGGARAWDYTKYNPWRITGDAQNRFDPLWGRVLPPTGDWFPDEALQLVRNANPPLEGDVSENFDGLSGPPPARDAPLLVDSPPPVALAPAKVSERSGGHVVPSEAPAVMVAAPTDAVKPEGPSPAARSSGPVRARERPPRQAATHHEPPPSSVGAPGASDVAEPVHSPGSPLAGPTFDSKNPYR